MINYLRLIDWRMIFFACLWINGLAIVVVMLGFAQYTAQRTARRFWNVFKESGYQVGLYAGLALFCLGLINSSRHWWETAIWILLGLCFSVSAFLAWRAYKPK